LKKEQTIKQKQKNMMQTYLVEAIGITVIGIYMILHYSAYTYDHPRVAFSDALTGALSQAVSDPLYCFPIGDFGAFLSNVMAIIPILLLFIFMQYTFDKLRVHHDVNTLKGSAKWADIHELVQKYADFDGKSYRTAYNNAILSQNFQMSLNHGKHFHALNTLILGATGSGKSRYELKPNLLQMNCSYVITDPKGEILQACGETLRRNGYKVRVFDLVEMGGCNTYNPMKYCSKESDVKKLVQAFIKNTQPEGQEGGGGNKDPFWDDSMNAFLCATIALLVNYGMNEEVMGGHCYTPIFANLCELTRMANSKWTPHCGINLLPGAELGDGKNNGANASKLAAIFENLRIYESEQQNCNPDEIVKPYCLREWENFRIAPEKTSTTILMTTAVRLDPFNIEQVKNLTSSDNIELDTFGNGRDALFVITPTNDKTYSFLVSFLYTQLFDILYTHGEKECVGSLDLLLPNGELVKHFSKEEVANEDISAQIKKIKNAKIKKITEYNGKHLKTYEGSEKYTKKILGIFESKKKLTRKITIDDSYYDILDEDGNWISSRMTKPLAEQYVKDLQHATERKGKGTRIPCHVRFLLDEFPNVCQIPEFKEKLATMRSYEISCTVICQTITQLKGMYPNDYEVVDANCPQTIFLGGDENSNNEYISKKLGMQTVKGWNNSVDTKKVNMSYNIEQRELMRPEELGKMPFDEEIVLLYGEEPILDKKYDYPKHKNYKYSHDYMNDIGCGEAVMFDRDVFVSPTDILTAFKPEKPIAIPSVKAFTEDTFMKIFKVPELNQAFSKAQNIAQNKFAVDSEAMAF